MSRSRLRDALTHWRTWVDVGALLVLCWFLLLVFRLQAVRELQSLLLANRHLLPLLPHGVATPRVTVGVLASLGIPLAVASLLAALALVSPDEHASELELESTGPDRPGDSRRTDHPSDRRGDRQNRRYRDQ